MTNMEENKDFDEESLKRTLRSLYDVIDQEGYSVAFYNSFKTYFEACMLSLPKDDVDSMDDYQYMKTSLLCGICARGMELCDELDLGLEITYIPFMTTALNMIEAMAYLNALNSNFFSPEEIKSFKYSLSVLDMVAIRKDLMPHSYRNEVMDRFAKFKESSGLVDEVIFDEDDQSSIKNISKIWMSGRNRSEEPTLLERFLPKELEELHSYLTTCLDSLSNVGHQIVAIDKGVLKNLVANAYLIATESIQVETIYDFGEYFKTDANYNKLMDRFEEYGRDYNEFGKLFKNIGDEISRNILETVLDAMYSNLLIETHSTAASNGSSLLWIGRYSYCIDRLLVLYKNMDTDGTIFQENNEFIVRKLLCTNVPTGISENDKANPTDHRGQLFIKDEDEARKILKSWNMPDAVVDSNIEYIIGGREYTNFFDVLEPVFVPDDLRFLQIIVSGVIMDIASARLMSNEDLTKLIGILKNTLRLRMTDPLQ